MSVLRGIVVLTLVLGCSLAYCQQLSTSVFSSDDELQQALANGDISYEQYVILREIILHGIDSTDQHLLDEIPNLIYLIGIDSARVDPLEKDQVAAFKSRSGPTPPRGRVRGRLGYRYYLMAEENQQSWYRSYGDLTVNGLWKLRFRLDREKSGYERMVSRALGYRAGRGVVRRVEAGSFTTRFGLGTLFGHRGKLLDFSEKIDGESFLYPDYGGYNGVLAELRAGPWSINSLASVTRDSRFRLTSAGLLVQYAKGQVRPGLIAGINCVTNRTTKAAAQIPMAAVLTDYRYNGGYLTAELGGQGGSAVGTLSAALEGRNRFQFAEIGYAAWRYDDGFIDLTSGSKSGQLYIRDTLKTADFGFRTRRSGQSGFLARTTIQLAERLSFANTLMIADNKRAERREQLSSGLIRRLGSDWQMRLSYLGRWRRDPTDRPSRSASHRVRFEARYDASRMYLRCYIGYDADQRDQDHVCLFASVRYVLSDGSEYQVWSDCGEIDRDGLRYWYAFVRGEWQVTGPMVAAARLSNTYRRGSADENATQLSLELIANL